jgi:hypothetical protein
MSEAPSPGSLRRNLLVEQSEEKDQVVGLELSPRYPVANLTKSFQRGLDLRPLDGGPAGLARELKLPRCFLAPIVTLIHRHAPVFADLLPDGKSEEKDGTMWITYEPLAEGANGFDALTLSRLPER